MPQGQGWGLIRKTEWRSALGLLWAEGRAGAQLGKSWVSAVAGMLMKGRGQH